MALHKKLEEFLKQIKQSTQIPFSKMTVEQMRQATKNFKHFQGNEEDIYKVVKKTIKVGSRSIRLNIFIPAEDQGMPCVLYFHAGGYVKGDIDYCEAFCRRIANGTHCVVVAVNYSLAPEYVFPAPLEDATEALNFCYHHISNYGADPKKLALIGESSGGNLAASLAVFNLMKQGPKISFQVLIYPQLDYSLSFPSIERFAEGYFLTKEALEAYANLYLPSHIDRKNPLVSPVFAKLLKGMPSTYLISAEYDPLQDEAEAFALELQKASVRVIFQKYPGMIHGFISMATLVDDSFRAILSICEAIKIAFSIKPYKKSA
jgi:acetyl esterase